MGVGKGGAFYSYGKLLNELAFRLGKIICDYFNESKDLSELLLTLQEFSYCIMYVDYT